MDGKLATWQDEMLLQSDDKVWAERPAQQWIHHMAVVRVMYLLELRVRLLEKMLTDFIDGVDIFISLHRDADPATLNKLEVGRWSNLRSTDW